MGFEAYTPEQIEALQKVAADELLFSELNLKINDKLARTIPFVFNKEQEILRNEVRRQEAEGRPVRIIILKARQLGFTTAVAGMFYYRAATKKNINAMVVAHDAQSATGILNKHKTFYDNSIPELAPMRKSSNAKEMLFENPSPKPSDRRANPGMRSRIEIETAGNPEAGRSKTIHLLHLSEMAFWPNTEKRTADQTFTALMQAVPNQPGTIVIIESTANGVGGAFYREWHRAVTGQSDFTPLFFPWHQHSEYKMPVPKNFVADPEEQRLMELYGIDASRIAWRRWCISSNCGGSLDMFHQEYPAEPEEAFLTTGRPVFDTQALTKAQKEATDPVYTGIMGEVMEGQERFARFQQQYKGPLKIWETPKSGVDYVIGIDTALGVKDGDYSCMQVIEKKSQKVVAVWHGHIDPDMLGKQAVLLGKYYNRALLAPESNSFGQTTINSIVKNHYGHIWRQRTEGRADEKTGFAYGINTNTKTKPLMIGALQRMIREDATRIKDSGTIDECFTFVVGDDNKTMAAQSGCHDDRVMALAMAVYAAARYVYEGETQEYKEVPLTELYHVNATTGY